MTTRESYIHTRTTLDALIDAVDKIKVPDVGLMSLLDSASSLLTEAHVHCSHRLKAMLDSDG